MRLLSQHVKIQKDSVSYKEKVERTIIFEFLARLNAEFKLVQIHILSQDELPTLNEVCAFSQSENSHQTVMHQYNSYSSSQWSTLASTPAPQKG